MQERDGAVYTPSRLNREVRGLLENRFGVIDLEGEVSNFSRAASGHCYFSLKDERAQVSCAMFRGQASRLKALPANGDQVQVAAQVSLYTARGNFQLIVQTLAPAGLGALQAQFEALKRRLDAEGLFARSRPLPPFPRRIAVISSPQGAAFKDVISVLKRRFPSVAVTLYPSAVQGEEAAGELRRRLLAADAHGHDVILLTRGGGSIEDLWAFNDEALARAIAGAQTPVVSAVGHEIDFTISDFAADLRAATPSAAAEALVPERTDLRQIVDDRDRRMNRYLRSRFQQLALHLRGVKHRLTRASPRAELEQRRRRLQRTRATLERCAAGLLAARAQHSRALTVRLITRSPQRRVEQARRRLQAVTPRLSRAQRRRLDDDRRRWLALHQRLLTLGPDQTLQRGYAIITDTESGRVVTRASDVTAGAVVHSRVATGDFFSVVRDAQGAQPAEDCG